MPLPEIWKSVKRRFRTAYGRGARMVSFCTGAYILAEAGLLDGRPAATLWTHADRFRARFPAVKLNPSVLYVDDGQVLTSAGNSAAADLALHILRADHGAAIANRVARQVAASAGFGTPTALRLHFRKALDTSPTQYRRTFRV